MKEVTLFITACGRPDLLKTTLESFLKYNTYPIKEAIIVEDSGQLGINDFAHNMLPYPLKIIYNEKQIGQIKSIEKGYLQLKTDYVFHCEEDWEFYDYGFIEESFKILDLDENITTVQLRSYDELKYKYNINVEYIDKGIYNICEPHVHLNESPPTVGVVYTWNPGLRTYKVCIDKIPFNNHEDEGTLGYHFWKKGMYSVITKKYGGYVRHIGWGRHIPIQNFS